MKNATPYHHRESERLLVGLPGDFSDIGYVKEHDCGRSCKLWKETSDSILTQTTPLYIQHAIPVKP